MKKKITSALCFLIAQLSTVSYSFAAGLPKTTKLGDYKEIIDAVNKYASIMSVFIVVFALASFIYNIIAIGTSSGNSARRSEAIRNVFIAGGVAAFVPFATVIVQFLMTF